MKAYNTYGLATIFTVIYKHNEDYLKEISQLNKNEISDKDYLIKILL